VLVLFTKVAFSAFYTAVHNRDLYPTFFVASGRAGSRYAQIFHALSREFQWKKLVILTDNRDKAGAQMAGHIKQAAGNMDVAIQRVHQSQPDSCLKRLKDIKEKNSEETGCVSLISSMF